MGGTLFMTAARIGGGGYNFSVCRSIRFFFMTFFVRKLFSAKLLSKNYLRYVFDSWEKWRKSKWKKLGQQTKKTNTNFWSHTHAPLFSHYIQKEEIREANIYNVQKSRDKTKACV
jgi:hypothetical protein